jgi:hypothetical protein
MGVQMSENQTQRMPGGSTSAGNDRSRMNDASSNSDFGASANSMLPGTVALGMLYVEAAQIASMTLANLAAEQQQAWIMGRSVTAAAVGSILGIPLSKPASAQA